MAEQGAGDQLARAREALAATRSAARARGARPAEGRSARGRTAPDHQQLGGPISVQNGREAAKPDTGVSGPGPSAGPRPGTASRPGFARQPQRPDPVRLSAAIEGLLDAEGWRLAVATGSVFGRWAEIVGPELAAHTSPEGLSDGELTVVADSTAWATQVRLLAAQVVLRLNSELGDGMVRRVKVRGPAAAGRRPGQWRVRGGRGPRDTYG